MDKLKNKRIIIFLIVTSIIVFVFGLIFITLLNNTDKSLVKEYITTFLNDIYENNIDYKLILKDTFTSNIFMMLFIWLLGISVIGIPVILFLYLFNSFTLGFAISSFIFTYSYKGIIFSILYIFPNELLKFFTYTLLIINSIRISKKLIISIIKKEPIYFNKTINKYFKILLICLFLIIISSLYEVYGIPFIFNKFYFLIK